MNTNNFLKYIKKWSTRFIPLNIISPRHYCWPIIIKHINKIIQKYFRYIFSYERVIAKIVFQTQHRFFLRIYNRQVKIKLANGKATIGLFGAFLYLWQISHLLLTSSINWLRAGFRIFALEKSFSSLSAGGWAICLCHLTAVYRRLLFIDIFKIYAEEYILDVFYGTIWITYKS